MSFRELSAWVVCVMLLFLAMFYGKSIYSATKVAGAFPPPDIWLLSVATIILVVGAIAAHGIAAALSPHDADAPEDERDRLVVWRAGNVSSWVLGFGVFAGLWLFYIQGDGNALFHILIGSVIAAQFSEYALQIFYYRRGV